MIGVDLDRLDRETAVVDQMQVRILVLGSPTIGAMSCSTYSRNGLLVRLGGNELKSDGRPRRFDNRLLVQTFIDIWRTLTLLFTVH